jgi:preprotein translocase subunit SecA
MNKQRETIYGLRRQVMENEDQREYLIGDQSMPRDLLEDMTTQYMDPKSSPDEWDMEMYAAEVKAHFNVDPAKEGVDIYRLRQQEIVEAVWEKAKAKYEEKEKIVGAENLRAYERYILLNIIDAQWKDHLLSIDHLKQGIGLVGYGQKDPLVEYKKQSFDMFQEMLNRIDMNTTKALFNLEVQVKDEQAEMERLERARAKRRAATMSYSAAYETATAAGEEAARHVPFERDQPKVGQNDPCPCGSGKKYKKCHGAGM